MALKAVIFDFGGVLVRTSDQSLRRTWEQRLNLAPGQAEHIVFGGETDWGVQLGYVTDAEHWRWIQQRFGLTAEDAARFREDFFAADKLDGDLLAYIRSLRPRYKTGLLSNASDLLRMHLTTTYAMADSFDAIVISAEEGLMKPDPRIFHSALTRLDVEPEEALFVDDVLANVEGARRIGMQALHFTDPETARAQLERLTGVR